MQKTKKTIDFFALFGFLFFSDYGRLSENVRPGIVWKNPKTPKSKKLNSFFGFLHWTNQKKQKNNRFLWFCEKIEGRMTEAVHMHNSEPLARVSSQKREI